MKSIQLDSEINNKKTIACFQEGLLQNGADMSKIFFLYESTYNYENIQPYVTVRARLGTYLKFNVIQKDFKKISENTS